MSLFGHIGHFISGALKNEVSHTGNLLGRMVHNPAKTFGQMALGAGDPFSAKMWNKVIGTHYTPLVGQLGGETEAQFQQSQKQGVDTSQGRVLGKIANTVAAAEAGGYFAEAGGLSGVAGQVGKSAISHGISSGAASSDNSFAPSGGVGASMSTSDGSGGMDFSSLAGAAGSLYSGYEANKQAGSLQQILNNAYGFNNSRPEYTKELNNLMANPEQAVVNSPGYKAQMDQALQASQRTAAAQGLTGSGTEAAALARTGADLEQSTYDKLFQELSMLSGATLNPAQLFQEQMSQQQTSQNASGQMFGGLASMFGGSKSGGSGGGLGDSLGGWLKGLFGGSGGGGDAASGVVDNGSINLFADAAGG